ncbi:MAG: chemotaxis protein CheW [Candidatus Limnocylindrales bacterium]
MDTQIVVFALGDERYGLEIATVFEIIREQPITAVPQAPASVQGVINLRGRIIPVVDLRERFGLAPADTSGTSRVVVCDANGLRVGLIVDGVSEVLMIPADAVEPTPGIAVGGNTEYVRGVAKLGEQMIILLDLDFLFSTDDRGALAA